MRKRFFIIAAMGTVVFVANECVARAESGGNAFKTGGGGKGIVIGQFCVNFTTLLSNRRGKSSFWR